MNDRYRYVATSKESYDSLVEKYGDAEMREVCAAPGFSVLTGIDVSDPSEVYYIRSGLI